MRKRLVKDDFEPHYDADGTYCLIAQVNKRGSRVSLEHCTRGYCVTFYDSGWNVIGERHCMEIAMGLEFFQVYARPMLEALTKAIGIANQLLKRTK